MPTVKLDVTEGLWYLVGVSDTFVLADANADRDHWLETRKRYLTSSDIYTWRGVDIPKWWSSSRQDIVGEKFEREERLFEPAVETSMKNGNFDEENIQKKFGYAVGAKTENCNKLFGCGKWMGLAASIDGFVFRPETAVADHAELCQDPHALDLIAHELHEKILGSGAWLCEIKKSTSQVWQDRVPDYYIPQLQCQMHILKLPAAVIVAETIKQVGRRKFWDLRAYIVYQDPEWESILDQCNDEFLEIKRSYDE